MYYCSIFFKDLTNHGVILCEFLRNTPVVGNFEKILLRKLRKMHDFSIFFKRFNEVCDNFSRVWTKNAICWKFVKIYEISQNISLGKLRKSLF